MARVGVTNMASYMRGVTTGEGTATRWPLVAWAVLDGAVPRCASLAAAAGAAAAAHGRMHLCQLAADAHNPPGDRAARWIRRRSREQGANACTGEIDAAVLKKRHCRLN